MASRFLNGPKPGFAGKAASLGANEGNPKAAPKPKPKPKTKSVPLPASLNPKGDTRLVPVRAHTRTIKTKPLAPKPVKPAKAATPPKGPSLQPGKTQGPRTRNTPFYPGQKPSRIQVKYGPRGGGVVARIPVYEVGKAGPSGDTKSQLNSAQLATAKKAGVQKTAGMKALEGAVHPLTDLSRMATGERSFKLKGAASDVANIASNFVTPEKAVGAAGVFGLGKAFRGAKVAKDVAEAGKAAPVAKAAATAAKIPPRGTLSNAERLTQLTGLGVDRGVAESLTHSETSLKGFKRSVAEAGNPQARAYEAKKLAGQQRLHDQHLAAAKSSLRKGVAPAAKDVAVFRGAVSGKTARAELKRMGENEKVGAKLDNPNFGKSARQVRAEQEAGYSAERSKRAAKVNQIYNNTSLSVAEREAAANAVLRGPLPKPEWRGMQDLPPSVLDGMKSMIMEHPTLMPFQKRTLVGAVNKAAEGIVPTNSELNLIETTFGKDHADAFRKLAANPSRLKDFAFEVGNIPRSIMASVDISGLLRQGIGAVTNHPIITGKNLGGMMHALRSESFYHESMGAIAKRANAPLYHEGGLAVTDLEEIGGREEAFASNLAEKLTGLGNRNRSPVRWSGRAYTYLLSRTRADIFDHYVAQYAKTGTNVHDPEFLKGLANMINSFTGRGYSLGGLARGTSGKALNTVLFSPRLMASRFDLLNPVYYAKMPKGMRLLALRHSLVTVGLIMSTLELARLGGLKVGLDPRSADFAKIKVGNTRIDIAAGYQQVVRVLAQLISGKSVSSSSGQVVNLRSGKYGQKSATDVLTTFFEGKESPLASMVSDWALRGGKNSIGQKMTLKSEAYGHLTPLLFQDARDIYKEKHGGLNGLAWAAGGYALGSLGVGMQTYGPPPAKSSGGSSGSRFLPGSSSGNGSRFLP